MFNICFEILCSDAAGKHLHRLAHSRKRKKIAEGIKQAGKGQTEFCVNGRKTGGKTMSNRHIKKTVCPHCGKRTQTKNGRCESCGKIKAETKKK